MIILDTCYSFLTRGATTSELHCQGRTHSHSGQTDECCRCIRWNSQFVRLL